MATALKSGRGEQFTSRNNIPDELIKRFSSNGINKDTSKTSQVKGPTSSRKLRSASAAQLNSGASNKANLERILLSVPLDNDVANFSDTEGPTKHRLPLYSENYESESFCLPSSGYKSDSDGRGRSKYKIRTSHSANPTPDQSPERPANRASIRRTRSLNVPSETDRVQDIRQRLQDCKRQETVRNSTKSNIHERLKQLGVRGLNTSNNPTVSNQKTVYDTRNTLRSRSLNQIASTEKQEEASTNRKAHPPKGTNQKAPLTKGTNQNKETVNEKPKTGVSRSKSFTAPRKTEEPRKQPNKEKVENPTNNKSVNTILKPSPNSAFDKVRQTFGTAKRVQPVAGKNDNLRSSSFSTLQDAWESRRAFDKKSSATNTRNTATSNKSQHEHSTQNTYANSLHQPAIYTNFISDVEGNDIVSRRRERRRLKKEIYNQRHISDKSDSETETEDSHFARHALERLERRRSNSNPRRTPSRSRQLSDDFDGSDSNDENNNECPSDKTLDSGVFDLALSNLSANICKLSNRYNSDEFLADCLSPKSGYSSATESLAESLAESTTTFYDSPDENDMDKRKRGVVGKPKGFKPKIDKTSAKTAVLNSTRAKTLLNGTSQPQNVNSSNKGKPSTTTTKTNDNIEQNGASSKDNIKHNGVSSKQQESSVSDLTKPQKKSLEDQHRLQKKDSVKRNASLKSNKTSTSKDASTTETKQTSTNLPKEDLSKDNPKPNKVIKEAIVKKDSIKRTSSTSSKSKLEKTSSNNTTQKKTDTVPTASKTRTEKKQDNSEQQNTPKSKDEKIEVSTSEDKKSKDSPQTVKKVPPPVQPKKKIAESKSVDASLPKKSTAKDQEVDSRSSDETTGPPTPPKTLKIGGLTPRKISHHRCSNCTPTDELFRSESPSQLTKKTRRISHHNCVSPSNDSRSSTPTKTRRTSHLGCFSPTEIQRHQTSDGDLTPTQKRRLSTTFKPVTNNSDSSASDNSRSNTPILNHSADSTSPVATPTKTKERRISHHNCLESPTSESKPSSRRHSLQHNSPTPQDSNNKMNGNYRIQVGEKTNIVVGPVRRIDEIQPKLARECISNTLSTSNKNGFKDIEHDLQSTQLSSIKENGVLLNGVDEQRDVIISIDNHDDKNGIKQTNVLSDERKKNEYVGERNTNKEQGDMSFHNHNKNNRSMTRYSLTADQQTQENNKRRFIRQGESIEVHLSLDPANKTTGGPSQSPKVAPKPNIKNASTNTEKQHYHANCQSLHKAVQCLLIENNSTETNRQPSTKVLDVSEFNEQLTINEQVVNEFGTGFLDHIHLTYPKYLVPESKKQTQAEVEDSDEDGLDETDSAQPLQRLQKEKDKSSHLKMENTRLQELLYEVEKARAGTMKALMHVNTVLTKVQGQNTELESEIKVFDHENQQLKDNVQSYLDKEQQNIDNFNAKKTDRSLSIFVDQWKKEKKELFAQLRALKTQKEDSEKANTKLQAQYKKVKEQLEHSNEAFAKTLENNFEATKRMEDEMKRLLDDRQTMLQKMNEGNKYKREMEVLKTEIEELQSQNEELQDENEDLEKKCKVLEKQKKQFQFDADELHEQIAQSQEIIENLSEVEDELKERLQLEMKDREYLQECLDETGNILFQLRNNEKRLKDDREVLLDDLEQEQEEKQSLQTTLNMTMDEHKEIVTRLTDMTNIHINVKESLQQANKKERNYQEQIEALTKTNHILHYTLEKEKEERMDLQEMFDIIESDHKKFKHDNIGRSKDLENKIDELAFENCSLKEKTSELEKQCADLQDSLEHEEGENTQLNQKLSRLEKLKEAVDEEIGLLQNDSEVMEKSKSGLQKRCQELEVDLKIARQKVEKLSGSLEAAEDSNDRSSKDLSETKRRLEEYRNDYDDLQSKNRERMKKIRELESSNEELTEQKERYHNRMNYYETETKDLRKKVNEQTEEIGTLQIESQRFQRERDTHKRNCDMAVNDFETHKAKCTETLKRLKDEIIELSGKIVEKDRFAMKQKEQYQDKIDNMQNDVNFLRSMLDSEIKRSVQGSPGRKLSGASDSSSEKLDLSILKTSREKFRDEFQSHCNKLEDLLKNSNEVVDTVTVVQSPMSKIKLEELKQIRNEMFELQTDLANIKSKHSNISAELTSVKLGAPSTNRRFRDMSPDKRLEDLENDLQKLNELISRIESRHKGVMTRNSVLLQRTLNEDERNTKDLVKKFQVIALESENKQLKTLLGILKKKYDFNENELADELKKANLLDDSNSTNGSSLNNKDYYSDEDRKPTRSLSTRASMRTPTRSMSTRRPQRNYSFFNEAVGASDVPTTRSTYTRDTYTKSSGVSSYSSEEEDDYTPSPRLPKRYNTLPNRQRRPKV
eukprot:TCONS_00023186-protein